MATRTQLHDLDVHYVPSFYPAEEAGDIIENLKAVEFNDDEDSKVFVFGKWYVIPRQQVAYGDTGTSYKFSGNTVPALPWPLWLEDIRTQIAEWLYENIPEIDWDADDNPTGAVPSFVLVNHYRDGKDGIGFHSDDEKDLAGLMNNDGNSETIIVSLSFGTTRKFQFQHKNAQALKREYLLKNGDLCVMRGKTQQFWKHSIAKGLPDGKYDGCASRWNLTFRWMKGGKPPLDPPLDKTKIEVGAYLLDYKEKEYEVISVTKKGTPRVRMVSGSKEYKTMHWSPKNNCWQLWGKPVKWTSD
jgi:DNA oxidative demethylase